MIQSKDTPDLDIGSIKSKPTDSLVCKMNNRLNGLYYYYLEEFLYGEEGKDNTTILGTTDAICSVVYVPFFKIDANQLTKIPYDTDRFGEITPDSSLLDTKPNVFRINPLYTNSEITLISKKLYNLQKPTNTTLRNWYYETKLHDYPYRTIIFYSNVFDKFEVIPHLIDNQRLSTHNTIKLNCCCPVSAQGNFYLNVQGYKDNTTNSDNILERYFVNNSFDIPNTSSAYSRFMSTQKAQTSVNLGAKLINSAMTPVRNAVNSGTLLGAGIGAGFGVVEGAINAGISIAENLAMKQDLITTPNSLISAGSDIISRLGVSHETYVYAGELTITDEYKERLGDYFAMYGYKQNKIMNIKNQLRSRYYYNYIKTIGCNLNGDIPMNYINEIKNIFDNGITLWHVDRNGGKFKNYEFDNTEVDT